MTRILSSSLALFLLLLVFVCHCAAADSTRALLQAVYNDDREGISLAIKDGADINARGQGLQTPLMAATLSGKTNAVIELLLQGADPYIPEKDGYTPMHGAGFQGRAEIAKLLMQHGLDKEDRHDDGFMPIHRACWGREERHTETVKVFLEHGVDPEVTATDGTTPLMAAHSNSATQSLISEWIQKKHGNANVNGDGEKSEL